MEQLSWLPAATRKLIDQTVAALSGALGEDLEAAALIGNAMNPARGDRARNPEIIALAPAPRLADLAPIARALHDVMVAGARVRLLSRLELHRSCDVFTLEIAEWRARHHLLHGADIFENLTWTPAEMRHSLETELRGISRRIRNRVLAGVATDGARDDPQQAVRDGIDRLLVAAYHALGLLGEEQPAEESAVLRAFAARVGGDAEPLQRHLTAARTGHALSNPIVALGELLAIVEPAIVMIDAWKPAEKSS
jgi:hypothetical protein